MAFGSFKRHKILTANSLDAKAMASSSATETITNNLLFWCEYALLTVITSSDKYHPCTCHKYPVCSISMLTQETFM